ncbi:MAG: hypothetical protein K8I04_03525 [Gammaproteobacteria bacterium]|nr:hypothetical protein [Gammaproteobacteria bacterium]
MTLNIRSNNPDIDRENWLKSNNISESELQKVIDKELIESEKQNYFINCPRPFNEYTGGAAIIFTVTKDKDWPRDSDDHRIICVKLEEVSESGKRVIIEEREYGGWPLSWSRDEACAIGYEKNLPVFGRDVLCDLTDDE